MSNQLISILMPVKNAGPFLRECLDSIVQQDHQHWELLAVNDHSSDDSADILNEYAASSPRIKALNNKGSGIIEALKTAYKASSGDFITRMDADDIMSKNKLSALLAVLSSATQPTIATGMVKYFSSKPLGEGYKNYENWLNTLSSSNSNFDQVYKECVIPSPCWMCTRADLNQVDAFNPTDYPEDYDLVFRWYEHNFEVKASGNILHHWRDHQERSSRTDPNYADNQFAELKLRYFLKLDRDVHRPLLLFGAGTRAKKIAHHLLQANQDFDWHCNNPNKIGKEIYGKVLKDEKVELSSNGQQCIVAIADPNVQSKFRENFDKNQMINNKDYFFFC